MRYPVLYGKHLPGRDPWLWDWPSPSGDWLNIAAYI